MGRTKRTVNGHLPQHNDVAGGIIVEIYRAFEGLTVSCARPFRRLAAITFAPAVVAIRTKKPWVVARFCLLG
jgi:hypothetical protein